jgi:hypothetical protein
MNAEMDMVKQETHVNILKGKSPGVRPLGVTKRSWEHSVKTGGVQIGDCCK